MSMPICFPEKLKPKASFDRDCLRLEGSLFFLIFFFIMGNLRYSLGIVNIPGITEISE